MLLDTLEETAVLVRIKGTMSATVSNSLKIQKSHLYQRKPKNNIIKCLRLRMANGSILKKLGRPFQFYLSCLQLVVARAPFEN